MNIYIWGTGKNTQRYLKQNEIDKYLCGFVQTCKDKDEFYGKHVYEPIELCELEYDLILVLVTGAYEEISELARKIGLKVEKMVFIESTCWIDGKQVGSFEREKSVVYEKKIDEETSCFIQEQLPCLYSEIQKRGFLSRTIIATYKCGVDEVDPERIVLQDGFDGGEYQNDYFRYRTFELVANQIAQENVLGDCAEVGVYKGTFSRLINKKFSSRKLYLFDTFEGFDETEITHSIEQGDAWDGSVNAFKDTSVEVVLNRMPYPKNCIIRKGLFPQTAQGLEECKYAFVSVDVDLENSIYECLKYFYPRMSSGGIMFVHDYNNRFYFGVKKAVGRYEVDYNVCLNKTPLADQGGTLIIKK